MTAESELVVGRYRLIERIGWGGASDVWRARDQQLERIVALKFLRRDADAALRQRFAGEAYRAAAVSHPNAVQVYDAIDDGSDPFIVMELVEGRSLDALLRDRGRFRPGNVADIVTQVAGALDAAHSVGIIHCDVKPANILMDGGGSAKLTGFGIVRTNRMEAETQLLGSAGYIGPEQLQGLAAMERTDVYRLGLVAYELLAGRPAFESDLGPEPIRARNLVTSPRLDVEVVGIAAGVADAVARAMDPRPERRYGSASGFADALAAAVRATERTAVLRPFALPHGGGSAHWLSQFPLVLAAAVALVVLFGAATAARASAIPAGGPLVRAGTPTADLRSPTAKAVAAQAAPNVVGMAAKDAARRLRERGFRRDIEIRVDFSAPGRKGTVFRQEPAAGAPFQPGQRATLVIIGQYDDD